MKRYLYRTAFLGMILLGLIASFISFKSFDSKLGRLLVESYYQTENAKESLVSVYFSDAQSDPNLLKSKLISFLETYDLNAYYNTMDWDTSESIVYVYSSDEEYMAPLFTVEDKIINLKDFDYYSTNSESADQRMHQYLSSDIRSLKSILNTNDSLYNVKSFHFDSRKEIE